MRLLKISLNLQAPSVTPKKKHGRIWAAGRAYYQAVVARMQSEAETIFTEELQMRQEQRRIAEATFEAALKESRRRQAALKSALFATILSEA